jgi:COMPASS component SWD3
MNERGVLVQAGLGQKCDAPCARHTSFTTRLLYIARQKFEISTLAGTMSSNSAHEHQQRRARQRSNSRDSETDARLQYGYDEDSPSDAGRSFHTPDGGSDNEEDEALAEKVERPVRLNYVLKFTLHGHKGGVAAVKISPNGKWIASCCETLCE